MGCVPDSQAIAHAGKGFHRFITGTANFRGGKESARFLTSAQFDGQMDPFFRNFAGVSPICFLKARWNAASDLYPTLSATAPVDSEDKLSGAAAAAVRRRT